MSNILDPNKQESISKVNIINEDKGILELELTANAALQRELYEQIYKKLSKNAEIEGFRKGHAPRELVEPKIYSELAEELVNQIAYLMIMELPNKLDDKYLLIGSPVVEKIDFKVVESPVVVKVKAFVIVGKKIPELKDFKVKFDEKSITVTEDEINKAIEQIFSEWKKQQKDDTFEKPSDDWVKLLKIPNVNDITSLRKYIKESIRKDKIVHEKIKLLEKTIGNIIEKIQIELPKELIEKQVEAALKQKRQEVERFGISLEKYLNYYKKDLNTLKKEIEEQVEKELKQETLKQLYVRQFNIKLDKQDHAYLELAMAQLRVPAEALQDFQVLQLVAQLALTFKVFDDIAERVGLGKIYAPMIPHHDHSHHHDEHHTETATKSQKTSSENKASKILIADE